jgi:hypothetical protein
LLRINGDILSLFRSRVEYQPKRRDDGEENKE